MTETSNLKSGWSQKKRRLKRICPNCYRLFTCSGNCNLAGRMSRNDDCFCKDCLIRIGGEEAYEARKSIWKCDWRYENWMEAESEETV